MRVLILVGLAFVASASALVEVASGYHQEVGIPLAEKIRLAEENIQPEAVENRIVGGSVAPANRYPFFAGMLIDLIGRTNQSVCGSTLVSANRLVTAAHCWYDCNNRAWRVRVNLGSNLLRPCGTCIYTTNVVTHPQYDAAHLFNDIAIIKLPFNVQFSNNIRPIALPTGYDLRHTFAGSRGVVLGFGDINDQQEGSPGVISHIDVQVINDIECQKSYRVLLNNTICTSGRGGVGACHGDSGGPLILFRSGSPILIGVVSFVSRNGCQVGFPTAYTRVTSFNNFILQHL